MKKDIESLLKFKTDAINCLASDLHVTVDEATEIIRLLETEDMIRLEAPEYGEKPAASLTIDRQLQKDDLSMTSHKPGNIIINTYLDWRNLAKFIVSSVETVSGLATASPFLLAMGIFSWLLSISDLTDIEIAENGTAIVLALQQYKKHKLYAATEHQCMKDANEILSLHGYGEMNQEAFQEEITKLKNISCIDILEGKIELIEKVIFPFQSC